jgi:hypothetical protein
MNIYLYWLILLLSYLTPYLNGKKQCADDFNRI